MTLKQGNRRDGCPAASESTVLARNGSEANTATSGEQVSDVAWFERHPHKNLRIRDAFPGELDEETAHLFQIGVTRRAVLAGQITAYIMRGVLS